jgi:DNA-binding transcriptional regulator YiaG
MSDQLELPSKEIFEEKLRIQKAKYEKAIELINSFSYEVTDITERLDRLVIELNLVLEDIDKFIDLEENKMTKKPPIRYGAISPVTQIFIGEAIKKIRKKRNLSQGDFYRMVDVKPNGHFSMIEKGTRKMSMGMLFVVAKFLRTEPWRILWLASRLQQKLQKQNLINSTFEP